MPIGKQNLKSILIHFWIILLGSLVVILPDLNAYLSTIMEPELAGLIIMFVWVTIKKILDKTE